MHLHPDDPDFEANVRAAYGDRAIDDGKIASYAEAIREAEVANMPMGKEVLRADDFSPEKDWSVLACIGYMNDDPYTGCEGVRKLADGVYRVTTRLATRRATSVITFTLRMMEPFDEMRHVFSPLLVRFLSGVDHRTRPVKISDSGRIRNELQTMFSQGLEHDGETIRVHFDRIDDSVLPSEKRERIREVLEWYREKYPVWFSWLEVG